MDTGHASCQFNSAWMRDDDGRDGNETGEKRGRKKRERSAREWRGMVARRECRFMRPRDDVTSYSRRINISRGDVFIID